MQFVYSFKEGNKDKRDLLGGKGANLVEMSNLGLPIPDGFTVTTEACHEYYKDGETIRSEIEFQILSKLKKLEESTGKKFGNPEKPLLVSVRSGAPISMPGMMDSILNLGMNDEITESLAEQNPRMAYDAYRRLISMYATVVKGYDKEYFDGYLDKYKETRGYQNDLDLTVDDLKAIVIKYKDNYLECGGEYFPDDPKVQLISAISAVFKSWNNDRAIKYRKIENISDELGTAVNVQEMVYGNMNDISGSGVLFTRNPSSGEKELTGEYLLNAQGEDIVSGVRTPHKLIELEESMPEVYEEIKDISKKMENHYKDMQDMEFTIENGKLYFLQTRNGKRTPYASVKIALDMLDEGLIEEKDIILRIKPSDLDALERPSFDSDDLKKHRVIAKGLAASPGASVGTICFTSKSAKENKDKDTILVRNETSPEDIDGMVYANGILTKNGGLTSHAAVVARGFGECCVCGATDLVIDENNKTLKIGDKTYTENDYISIDGNTGYVYEGKVNLTRAEGNDILDRILNIISKYETIEVRANADTPESAKTARKLGAKGIGLVRTEHMFFKDNRILDMRKMILSQTNDERENALVVLEKYQYEDFVNILREMDGMPVIVRYLDPPLHEFLPKTSEEIETLSNSAGISKEEIIERTDELKEVNPMMGFRGCRLGVKYPEISIMQTKALINAGITLKKEGLNPIIEIMIPLTTDIKEFNYIKDLVKDTIDKILTSENISLDYKIGTMIETPRGAIMSKEISESADFYSFGTNDLTQLTFGLSRDDAGKFIDIYLDTHIYQKDPFKSLDTNGVGELMKYAKETAVRNIEMGICGEHGGEEESIKFCQRIGLNYVSCSPYRIPGARLVSAKCSFLNE